jgi:hypothetical protein
MVKPADSIFSKILPVIFLSTASGFMIAKVLFTISSTWMDLPLT